MRYTTIIDISEMPTLYHNINVRMVYLHLVLKAGYHDNDRDIVTMSLRRLAADLSMSIAAVRHAIAQLESAQLLTRQGQAWVVKKWLMEQKISTRARTAKQQRAIEIEAEKRRDNEKREREALIEQQRRELLAAQGKTSFMIYYESLQKKAAAGDMEAAELVKKHQRTYNQHRQNQAH